MKFDSMQLYIKVEKNNLSQMLWLQGFVMNLQPSEAEAGFDIRIPPLGDIEDLQRRIDEDWAPASRNFTYSVTVFNFSQFFLAGGANQYKLDVMPHKLNT